MELSSFIYLQCRRTLHVNFPYKAVGRLAPLQSPPYEVISLHKRPTLAMNQIRARRRRKPGRTVADIQRFAERHASPTENT